jgi:hypothetical protein
MKYTKIKPPKYRIGRNILNEYELRKLMKDVCLGLVKDNILVKDEKGQTATILQNGRLSNNLFGLDINSNYTLEIIKINRLNQEQENLLENKERLEEEINKVKNKLDFVNNFIKENI